MQHVDVDSSVGYALKRAQSALRAAMEASLREHALSVAQYACLEQLARQPQSSNADLARSVFVSRQAMHQLLGALRTAGLVAGEGEGRGERLTLTAAGARRLAAASAAVAAVEDRMLAGLTPARRARLRADLAACVEALDTSPSPES